jgi:hypothetical protein
MEAASPARLYATVVGALLVVLGIVGFFYSASFGSPGHIEAAFADLWVNGWLNLLHVAVGAIGLSMAGYAARRYALWLGAILLILGIWGLALGAGESILGVLPSSGGNDGLHVVVGLLGLAAAAGTPHEKKAKRERRGLRKKRRLKPRAKAAAESS